MKDEFAIGVHLAKLKANWATIRCEDTQRFVENFLSDKPYNAALDQLEDGDLRVSVGLTKPMPANISLLVGEVVHAQRTALDYLWMGLVRSVDPDNRKSTFPFKESEKVLRDQIRKDVGNHKNYSEIEELVMKEIKAYTKREMRSDLGNALYEMKELDNWDKHNLIVTSLAVTHVRDIQICATGLHNLRVQETTAKGGRFSPVRLSGFKDARITNDPEVVIQMIVGEHREVPGGPLLPLLTTFSKAIAEVIQLFEQRLMPPVATRAEPT